MATQEEKKKSRSRRRGTGEDYFNPFDAQRHASNQAAAVAFRVAVVALIPGLGLVLGPVAAVLGYRAHHKGQADAQYTGKAAAIAALVLGLVVTATSWVGLGLMIAGVVGW